MYDHAANSSHNAEAISRKSSQACQPSWMSHWTKGNAKAALKVSNSSLIGNEDGFANDNSGTAPSRFKMEDGISKSGKGVLAYPQMLNGVNREEKKLGIFKNEDSDLLFPTQSHCHNSGTTPSIQTQVNREFGHKNLSLALALGREDTSTDLNLLHENNWRRDGKQPVCNSFDGEMDLVFPTPSAVKQTGSAFCHESSQENASGQVVVFEKQFSNDNFTCFGKDNSKYRKYSSFFIHETGMNNDRAHHEVRQNNGLDLQYGQSGNKNFQGLFYKKQGKSGQDPCISRIHQGISHQGSYPPEGVPCFRNVETMRICTMVDAVGNSPGSHHKVSQRAHHFLYTKETCVNMSNEDKMFGPFHASLNVPSSKPSGVKIQPLWTSTDSDEKTGNSSTIRAGSRNEASGESSGMQVEPPKKRHMLSDIPSPVHKDDTVDRNSTPAACDSSTEKTRIVKPLLEIPDINEKLPELQPAASSTDGEETSTSRVHSLDAKQIFTYGKQTSRNEYNAGQERPLGPDTSNRWIKRLKLSTSDSIGVGTKSSSGEGSSHGKFNSFFNRYVKGSRESFESKLNKHHYEGQTSVDENIESTVSRNRNQGMKRGSSWIQRWCQNSTAPVTRNPEPLVICEPHSLKFGQEETAKKHFPSIGALALMGKAMNGFRSCEFSKRGPVVVWNTKDY